MSRVKCGYCGAGHSTEFCPKTAGGSTNRERLRCGYCGADWHNTDGCPKTAGGPAPLVKPR